MRDIVEQLRKHHVDIGLTDNVESWLTAAADEIERLREALREAREEIICISRKWVECEASEEELVGFIDAVLPRSALEEKSDD